MSVEKMKLRSAAMHEVGMRLDDMLTSSEQEILRAEGEARASVKAMERVLMITEMATKDAENGDVSHQEVVAAKKYLSKASASMRDMATDTSRGINVLKGVIMGLKRSVKETRAMYDREIAKYPVTVESGGEMKPSKPARAGRIKDIRRAEEEAEMKEKAEAVATSTKEVAQKKTTRKRATKTATKTATKKTTTKRQPRQ